MLAAITTLFTIGCGDVTSGSANLSVLVEAEDVIVNGLQAGDDGDDIRDGWDVSFDKYITSVGHIDIHLASDEAVVATAPTLWTVDLTKVPAAGLPLWSLDHLASGRWQFFYAVEADSTSRHGTVSEADDTTMRAHSWTYLVEGRLSQPEGLSCPPALLAEPPAGAVVVNTKSGDDCYANENIHFVFGASANSHFGPCEVDNIPGFALPEDGTKTVAITIHGDHLFFNGFPEGSEGGIMRLAQWLADCDLNLDGEISSDELQQIAPADLPEFDDRFQLGGSPITPLDNMWTYVTAQLMTQGHFQGEGECPINGATHDHR